jgi:putative SOS response-associated peptidase YedK
MNLRFLIVTAAADQGLVDIHDRRPLVLTPEAAREWMRQDLRERGRGNNCRWRSVSRPFHMAPSFTRVGNLKNQGLV